VKDSRFSQDFQLIVPSGMPPRRHSHAPVIKTTVVMLDNLL
jgi:hypothetical protein